MRHSLLVIAPRLWLVGVGRWMVSGRTADLARCGIEGALEVDCLAYTLKLAQERGANMSCEVKPVEGLIAARQQNR